MTKEKDPYTKRVSIAVPTPIYERLNTTLQWGERNRILVRLIEWMLDKIEAHGKEALILLLRESDLNDLLSMGLTKKEQAN